MSPLILILTIGSLVGVAAAVLGWRGRRIDDHPWCRRCRFDLFGLDQPEICPECGADLHARRAVRFGQRRKRPIVLTAGLLMLILSLTGLGVLGYGRLNGFNWNTIKPTAFLMWQSGSDDPALVDGVVTELFKRAQAGELSVSQIDALAARGLDWQGDRNRPWIEAWGDVIELAAQRDLLTDEEGDRYVRQAVVLDVSAPERVPEASRWRIHVAVTQARVGSSSNAFLSAEPTHWTVGDETLLTSVGRRVGGIGLRGSSSGSFGFGQDISLPPGEYESQVRLLLDLHFGISGASVGSFAHEAPLPLKVVAPGTPMTEMVADPRRRADVHDAIEVRRLEGGPLSDGRAMAKIRIDFGPAPVDLAFTIHLRTNAGREWRFGTLAHAKHTAATRIQSSQLEAFSAEAVDVILRPSPDAAAALPPDHGPIWGEEIVVEDVRVQWTEEAIAPSAGNDESANEDG